MKDITIRFTKDDEYWYKIIEETDGTEILFQKNIWFDEFNTKEYFDDWENQLRYVLNGKYNIVKVERFI